MNLPDWFFQLPWKLIKSISEDFNVDPIVIASLIMAESSGIPSSTRFEPTWSYHYNIRIFAEKSDTTPETEKVGQSTSWGLMQVMGTTAREMDFHGKFPELCDPKLGIKFGVMYFKKQLERYGNTLDAVAAYNLGSVKKTDGGMYINEKYIDKVMGYHREIESFY